MTSIMNSRFRQVTFTDDFFRSSANGLQYHALNRRFLRGLFDLTLSRLGISINEASALREGGTVDVERLMDRLRLPTTPTGWASACNADLMAVLGAHGMPTFGPDCLVIGWGLPPSLQQYIDHSGASYIDLEIDPIRFAAHLHLCARTNDPAIAEALQSCRVDEEEIWNHASAIKSYFARHGAPSLFAPQLRVGVFFGQSLIDLSLISQGRAMLPADVIAPLKQLAESVDLLVIKPHPYEPALHHLAAITRAIPNLAWTRENTYALLSANNLHFAAGLSSSVLTEAGYFMKPAKPLIQPDRNNVAALPASCSPWISVGPDIASMAVMAAICGDDTPSRLASWPTATIDWAFSSRWGLDTHNEGLRQLPPIQIGRSYSFGTHAPSAAWLTHGWHEPEPWGTWSDKEQACIVIPLPQDIGAGTHAIDVRIEGHVYQGHARSASVRAFFDGKDVPAILETSDGRISFLFSRMLDDQHDNRPLVIQFAIDDRQRPCDQGESTDSRHLGFGLTALCVSTHKEKEEVLLAA